MDAAEPAVREDGWINALTGMGVATKDNRLATTFSPDFVDYQTATDLWRGDDMAAKLVEAYPEEMLREGYEIRVGGQRKAPLPKPPTGPSAEAVEKAASLGAAKAAKPPVARQDAPYEEAEAEEEPDEGAESPEQDDEDSSKELQEDVHELFETLELDQALFDALCYESAYGGGAVLLGVDDGQTMDKELDLERVKPDGFKYVLALEPLELAPQFYYDDPLAPKYGKVSHWTLSPISRGTAQKPTPPKPTQLVHESRLIIFGGIQVGRRVQHAFDGFGDSVFHRVIRVLRDFNMTWNAASVLVNNFSVAVMKVKNLAELILNDKSGKFKDRMKAIQLSQAVLGMTLVDAEGEDFERKTTSIAGLPDLLDKFSVRFGAAADMPLTVIFGQAPAGMDATGDNDLRIFYQKTKKRQKKKLRPALKRLAEIAFRALGAKPPEQWSVYFCPLWQPTEKEQAETRQIVATTDEKYVAMGVVTPEEVGMSRWGGDDYSPEMHVDFSAEAMEEREAARAAQEELDRAAMQDAAAKAEGPDMVEEAGVPRGDAFDPDQERDENGMWVAAGGGSGRAKTPEEKAARTAKHREIANKAGKSVAETHERTFSHERERAVDRKYQEISKAKAPSFGLTPQEHEARTAEREAARQITDEDRAAGQERGLDAAKNEFESLERDAAELDRVFDEIEKRGVKGPAAKALNAYKETAGKVGKDLDAAARDTIEKTVEYNRAAREASRAYEALQHEGDDYVADEVLEEIAGLEELTSDIRISDDAGVTLGELAKGARQLRHIGAGTVPRDGELDRVSDDIYSDIAGDSDDVAKEPEDSRPFRERFAAYRASVDALAEKLPSVEAAQKPLAATFKGAYKELDKASDGAIAELDSFEASDEIEGKALDLERDARDITMAGFDEGFGDPKEVGKGLRSTAKSVAKLQKALAKIQTAVDTMKEPEPEPDDEEGDEDTDEEESDE